MHNKLQPLKLCSQIQILPTEMVRIPLTVANIGSSPKGAPPR